MIKAKDAELAAKDANLAAKDAELAAKDAKIAKLETAFRMVSDACRSETAMCACCFGDVCRLLLMPVRTYPRSPAWLAA